MAFWIYAYGKNAVMADSFRQTKQYLNALNKVPLQEVKILDSLLEGDYAKFTVREFYAQHREDAEKRLRALSEKDYQIYLNTVQLPGTKVEKLVDTLVEKKEKEEHERLAHFRFAYGLFKSGQAKSRWELKDDGSFFNRLCYFDPDEGLRIRFINDLICITGPDCIFEIHTDFQHKISAASRDYYHSYFKDILKVFKSDFILYAHEWSGLDHHDYDFNYEKLKEQAEWEETSSDSIHNMYNIYYEKL